MSDSSWSDNPNAPKIPYPVYYFEKVLFAGDFISLIIYGIIIVLSFKCIAALFNPVHRRGESIKWGLVSYTVVMFSLVTIGTAMQLDVRSISYIDDRGFPGIKGVLVPGPAGYQSIIVAEAIVVAQNAFFVLNNWLADGFLLYRCYVVYSMNLWVIVFPCLMYLASVALGIGFVYQAARPSNHIWSAIPYLSISLSLNVLLTLMIVIRLVLQIRTTRTALGITGVGGLGKAIVVMLVESCTLYAVSSLLVVGPLGAENNIWNLFVSLLAQTQVIAPLLIILRVADKSALTRNTIASGRIGGLDARTQGELTGGNSVPPGGDPVSFTNDRRTNSGEVGIGFQTTDTDNHQDGI